MKTLLYPCSRDDWEYFFIKFLDDVDKFIFADIYYSYKIYKQILHQIQKYGNITKTCHKGRFSLNYRKDKGITYKNITPEYFYIQFEYNGKEKEVILRRGSGQYALIELEDCSLDYFVHRGDSGNGEGGSGIYFLSNSYLQHKPIAMLYDKLIKKLKPNSYIIFDGSNVGLKPLKNFYKKIEKMSEEELSDFLPIEIELPNSILRTFEILDRRRNYTIMWKVKKVKNEIRLETKKSWKMEIKKFTI